jgi:hypothetical protein
MKTAFIRHLIQNAECGMSNYAYVLSALLDVREQKLSINVKFLLKLA